MAETKKSPQKKAPLKFLITQQDSSMYSDGGDNIDIHKDDEMREISMQLTMIRKKHDQTKRENSLKRHQLERSKKELEKLGTVAEVTEMDERSINQRIEQLETALELTHMKVEEELLNKKSYEHMLNRMNLEKVNLQVTSNHLSHTLKSSKMELESEKEKSRKNKELNHQSKKFLQELKANLEFEKRKKEERVQQLERSVKMRKDASERRQERLKRQAEIAEAAANEDRDSQEIQMKEQLLINRFWYMYLRWKLEKEWQSAAEVEEAFQKIRAATGLSNVKDIVQKFLTREEVHQQLMQSISEAEKTLDDLKAENEKSRNELKELLLIEGETNERSFYKEFKALEEKLAKEQNELLKCRERNENSTRNYEHIFAWGKKIMSKLDNRLDTSNMDLVDLFNKIKEKLEVVVTPLLENKEAFLKELNKYESKKTDQLLKEIYTPDFIAKNSRVRPKSPSETSEQGNEEVALARLSSSLVGDN
ncbi:unnamed protein product [Blepharisma stoltei]|uniref:Uncharacterized protein n=1 Tax=Blepharisma stoltei TaxID=1481888 RepID=A0AAU9JTZ9_9CILI|nr:unnamed protein product [Blepharisma stoltei]